MAEWNEPRPKQQSLLSSSLAKMAVVRSRPPPRGPKIPLVIADAPTQRLYLFSAFILLSAWKFSDFLFPSASPAVEEFNWKLARWMVVDLASVSAVGWLRVPRLDWGWKEGMATRGLLLLVDWLLFGRWEVSTLCAGKGWARNEEPLGGLRGGGVVFT